VFEAGDHRALGELTGSEDLDDEAFLFFAERDG